MQSSVPEDGRNYRPKHVELIEIINKLLLFLVSIESRSFKFCWKSEYTVLLSITVLKVISSQVHPSSTPLFDVFVATIDVVVVVVLSLCCCCYFPIVIIITPTPRISILF